MHSLIPTLNPPKAFWKILLYTWLALLAFAANSVLCRLALGDYQADALSFTVVRLLSGALTLMLLVRVSTCAIRMRPANWLAPVMLFCYALCFSFAYVRLDVATGALILFASVHITMLVKSIWDGELLNVQEWLGISLALFGFVYLVLPDLHTPSTMGFLLMTLSGISWGIYTVLGRGSSSPLADTASNFVATTPLVLLLLGFGVVGMGVQLNLTALLLAVTSGSLASAVGYALWYDVLPSLSSTQAAVVQLMVPVLAAFGGVFMLDEQISIRLLQAAAMMLGGIALVFLARKPVASVLNSSKRFDN